MAIKLKYNGRIVFPDIAEDLRLWTIDHPGDPYHKSTRTLQGLKELGIVK